jgi:WD40 repeat protein
MTLSAREDDFSFHSNTDYEGDCELGDYFSDDEEENNQKKITTINFLDNNILFITFDNGFYGIYDTDSKVFTKLEKLHENSIKSVSFNKDRTKLITSSIDCTCKIINLSDYKCEVVIENIVPCNYAVFSPLRNYVIVGGGIDAMLVSQKSNNDFTSRFYSGKSGFMSPLRMDSTEEIARMIDVKCKLGLNGTL